MAILNQKKILNLIPKVSAPVTIHVSQGDVGTEIEFTLVKGDEVFSDTGNLTASVHGVREDGANFGPFTCTLSGSKVIFPLHSEMTEVKGSAIAEIVIVDNGGNKVGSANFGILVEESVFPLGVTYDNDVSVYESILKYVQTIPSQLQSTINSLNTALNSEIGTRQSADALINTRIDEIIAPSGEAPSAAEVADARIGADGVTYNTLGGAIRTQIDTVNTYEDLQNDDINSIKYYYYPLWTNEYYDNQNQIQSSEKRCLSEIIKNSIVRVKVNDNYNVIPVWLDDNGNVIQKGDSWLPSGTYLFKGLSNNFRICIKNTSNSNIRPYEMLAAVEIETFNAYRSKVIDGIDLLNKQKLTDPLVTFEGLVINNAGVITGKSNIRAVSNPVYTDYIEVKLIDSAYLYQIIVYNASNDSLIYKSNGWQTAPLVFKLHDCYIRVVVAKVSTNSKITPSEAKSAVSILASLDNNYYSEYSIADNQNLLDTGEQIEHTNITQLRPAQTYCGVPFAAFTNHGVLIVGGDSRLGTGDDTEPIEVLVTRSTDGGETFETAQTLFERGTSAENSRVNDCTILATKSGRVFVFAHWCDSDVQWQIMNSDVYDADRADFDLIYKYSDDDGQTWSDAISLKSIYFSNSDIMTILGGLTSGIETESGMLIVGISCKMKSSNTDMSGDMFRYQSTFMYSTDGGDTWTLHNSLTPCNALEPTIVEYEPNKFVMNCRGYINARRMFTFEYNPSTQTFSDIELSKGDCVIPEPTGHPGHLFKFQYGYKTIGLYGGSNAMGGNDRGKQTIFVSKDYCHFYPLIPIRNVSDSRYGMMCFASYKGHLILVYTNASYMFIANLDKYVPILLA